MLTAHAMSYVALSVAVIASTWGWNTPSPSSLTVPLEADPARQYHIWLAAMVAVSVWPFSTNGPAMCAVRATLMKESAPNTIVPFEPHSGFLGARVFVNVPPFMYMLYLWRSYMPL